MYHDIFVEILISSDVHCQMRLGTKQRMIDDYRLPLVSRLGVQHDDLFFLIMSVPLCFWKSGIHPNIPIAPRRVG